MSLQNHCQDPQGVVNGHAVTSKGLLMDTRNPWYRRPVSCRSEVGRDPDEVHQLLGPPLCGWQGQEADDGEPSRGSVHRAGRGPFAVVS